MVGAETASIVVGVVALIGTVANAALTGWISYRTEHHKRSHAMQQVVAKYRDPLLLAAEELSHKLMNLIENNFASWLSDTSNSGRREYVAMHTSFVFGQFFCWIYILRRETQFLRPSSENDVDGTGATIVMNNIRFTLNASRRRIDAPFEIWTGDQQAMGEFMTVKDDNGQLRCMGYGTFVKQWKEQESFRDWFKSIVGGISEINRYAHYRDNNPEAQLRPRRVLIDERIRCLQHELVDLIEDLDLTGFHPKSVSRCRIPGGTCSCRECNAAKRRMGTKSMVEGPSKNSRHRRGMPDGGRLDEDDEKDRIETLAHMV